MSLELNLEHEYTLVKGYLTIPHYKEYVGRVIEEMSQLIADGRVPMNVSQLMQRRLDVRNSDHIVKSYYENNYFTTGDAIVCHPEGDFLIDLDSVILRSIYPNPPRLREGAWLLSEERDVGFALYEQLKKNPHVFEFKNVTVKKSSSLQRNEALSHPIWRILLRHPDYVPQELAIPGLLEESVDYIFTEYQRRFFKTLEETFRNLLEAFKPESLKDFVHEPSPNEDIVEAMSVYPPTNPKARGNIPEMIPWTVGMLKDKSYTGCGHLDAENDRLVGIAPAALEQKVK